MEPPSRPEPGWDLVGSPFHEGELQVQRRLGMEAKIDTVGRRSVRREPPRVYRRRWWLSHAARAGVSIWA